MGKAKSKWMPFKNARKYIHSLNIKNDAEWRLYCKGKLTGVPEKPKNIPATPQNIYDEYTTLGDWLGTFVTSNKSKRLSYLHFKKARAYVRKLKLKSRLEFNQTHRKGDIPENIPIRPERVYAGKGYINMGDWLGTGYIPPKERDYLSFNEARKFSSKLGLRSRKEWETYCLSKSPGKTKKPDNIPATPARIYKDSGWKGWPYWLGKKSPYIYTS